MFGLIAAAISAIAPSVISGIGNALGAGKRSEAEELRRQAMAEYNIDLPPLEQIEAELQGNTELGKTDPRTRQAQMEVLQEMMGRAKGGGMNDMDKARTAQMQRESASQERGQREAVMQQMAARGMGGGGNEYAAMLAAQQGSANRGSQQQMDIAAMAQQSALESLAQAGGMAGNVRGQDYQAAGAQDSINRFNAQQRQSTNVFNLGQKQQNFDNKYKLATGRANAEGGFANSQDASAARQQQTYGAIGQGVGQAAGTAANYLSYDDWLKKQGKGGV